MAKLVCVFAIVALLAVSANALKCYECPLGCKGDDKTTWNTQDCGAPAAGQEKVCVKQVIKLADGKDRTVRKCGLHQQGKKYECVEATGEKTIECQSCTTDLCNSSASVTFSFLAFASVILPFLASRMH